MDEKFKKTQDLDPVREMVYSIMMWKTSSFIKEMASKGYAILHGKVGYHPVSKLSALIVKTADDLKLINYILRSDNLSNNQVEYDRLAHELIEVKKNKKPIA